MNVNIVVEDDVEALEICNVLCTALAEYKANRSHGVAEAYVSTRYEYLKPGSVDYAKNLARVKRNFDVAATLLKALRQRNVKVST